MTQEADLMELMQEIEDVLLYEEHPQDTIYNLLQERFMIMGEAE
jgi:hypothetical protein